MSRRKWTDEAIGMELRKAMESLMIERMPTAAELLTLGRNDLHVVVGRTKKYSGWAQHLGLDLKSCDTRTGQEYEEIAKALLELRDHKVERMTTKYPYDLLVNEKVKIDVKVSKPTFVKGSRCHAFGIKKKSQTCDIYICFAVDEQNNVEKIFVIPSHFAKVATLCVGRNSVYDRFVDAWYYVKQYVKMFDSIK